MSELRAINADGELVEFPNAAEVVRLREQNEDLRARVDNLKESLGIELEEKRRLRARLSQQTGERNQARELDPFWDICCQWFERWRETLAPNAREFGDKRWSVARARAASGYTLEDGMKAVAGAKRLPDKIVGGQRKQMQEFEYIFRSAPHMDRFISDADDEVPTSSPLRVVDPSKELREAFLAHPGALLASKHGDPVRATGFCMECALEHREGGVATLDEDRLHCSNGCTHDVQAKALLDWYRHSGLVRCGECGQRKAAA